MNILSLVSSMVWDGGLAGMTGPILEPPIEDVQWFIDEATEKIFRYIGTYGRIDSMQRAHFLILRMIDEQAARDSLEEDSIQFFYEEYIRGNPELEATVGLPENLVFDGFEGPVLEAEPPLY